MNYLPGEHNDKVNEIPGVAKIGQMVDHETHRYNFDNTLKEKEACKDIADDIESPIVPCC